MLPLADTVRRCRSWNLGGVKFGKPIYNNSVMVIDLKEV